MSYQLLLRAFILFAGNKGGGYTSFTVSGEGEQPSCGQFGVEREREEVRRVKIRFSVSKKDEGKKGVVLVRNKKVPGPEEAGKEPEGRVASGGGGEGDWVDASSRERRTRVMGQAKAQIER